MFTFCRQSVQFFGQLTWSNLSDFRLVLQEPLLSCWLPRRPTLAAEKRLAPVVLPMQFRAKNLKLLPMQTMMTCLWPSKLFSGDKQGKIYFFNSQDSLRWCSSLCFFPYSPFIRPKFGKLHEATCVVRVNFFLTYLFWILLFDLRKVRELTRVFMALSMTFICNLALPRQWSRQGRYRARRLVC